MHIVLIWTALGTHLQKIDNRINVLRWLVKFMHTKYLELLLNGKYSMFLLY